METGQVSASDVVREQVRKFREDFIRRSEHTLLAGWGELLNLLSTVESALVENETRIRDLEANARRYAYLRECSPVRSDRTLYVVYNRYKNGVYKGQECPCYEELDQLIDQLREGV